MGMSMQWLGGFCDGEGYFGIVVKKNVSLRLHFELIPLVSISRALPTKAELEVLYLRAHI
jgi:hypothetical protein